MLEPHDLYELTGDLPDLGRPVLVQALTGFVDAGGATRLAREQLMSNTGTTPVVRFDIDALLDYRSRRPTMLFVEDHWESYDEPRLGIYVAYDQQGTPFLVLSGSEPDLAWERFTRAVIYICAHSDAGAPTETRDCGTAGLRLEAVSISPQVPRWCPTCSASRHYRRRRLAGNNCLHCHSHFTRCVASELPAVDRHVAAIVDSRSERAAVDLAPSAVRAVRPAGPVRRLSGQRGSATVGHLR